MTAATPTAATWKGQADLERAARSLASRLPPELRGLAHVAYNYRWSWAPRGPEVFRDLDPEGWQAVGENPVRLLLEAPPESLRRAAGDRGLLERARALEETLRADLARPFAASPARPVIFLCAEYGVHPSLPLYSGGLGVLAGDVLKEASDRALPLVGVGLLYREGTFHQRVDASGSQREEWFEVDPGRLPAATVTGEDGRPLTVSVRLWGREVRARIWRVDVGRVPLYLLDAAVPENAPEDRSVTARLYTGDRRLRLAQYALLGMGGVRALRALGIEPGVLHLNEGHASFAPLELAREAVRRGRPFGEALDQARGRAVFTTHTPVPAGNETYSSEELRDVLGEELEGLGVGPEGVFALGRSGPEDRAEPVGLTVLGIRATRATNGVSRRHGQVARRMWQHLFPGRPEEEVPIGEVTNGVHLPTWMAPPMRALLDRHLGPEWTERAAHPATWEAVEAIPDEELWAVRCELRAELVAFARARAWGGAAQAPPRPGLDPHLLTVGFARRVAAYKRLHLLVHDPGRLARLLAGPPGFQLVVAGKAHPSDEEAKGVLRRVLSLWDDPRLAGRVVFLEDYDLAVARRLVAGCDLWLNLPRPPLEASGTSGMKAALNGALNLSTLDGWWEEAYDGTNGWAVAAVGTSDPEAQDAHDAEGLYGLLGEEVLPLFHDRAGNGPPAGWVRRIKRSLATLGPRYNAARMLDEYRTRVYRLP